MDENHWRKLQLKISEQGFEGRGKLERFMEKIVEEVVIFIKGSGKFEIVAR